MKIIFIIPVLLFQACIIIPLPAHRTEGRVFIKPEMLQFIRIDTTKREEVLLKFGDPDGVAMQQQVLIYHWTASRGIYGIGGGYSAAIGEIKQERFFLISFNANNTVRKMEIFNYNIDKRNKTLQQFVQEWNAT
ncbi:MAG TPA: hypothetical protein VLR49_01340 [Ferruginibacter sp.]|nr:hypothetical protein [Ferruginibacter sp.]